MPYTSCIWLRVLITCLDLGFPAGERPSRIFPRSSSSARRTHHGGDDTMARAHVAESRYRPLHRPGRSRSTRPSCSGTPLSPRTQPTGTCGLRSRSRQGRSRPWIRTSRPSSRRMSTLTCWRWIFACMGITTVDPRRTGRVAPPPGRDQAVGDLAVAACLHGPGHVRPDDAGSDFVTRDPGLGQPHGEHPRGHAGGALRDAVTRRARPTPPRRCARFAECPASPPRGD